MIEHLHIKKYILYIHIYHITWHILGPWVSAESAGAEEYTDCTSVEEEDPLNECPSYDTK